MTPLGVLRAKLYVQRGIDFDEMDVRWESSVYHYMEYERLIEFSTTSALILASSSDKERAYKLIEYLRDTVDVESVQRKALSIKEAQENMLEQLRFAYRIRATSKGAVMEKTRKPGAI